MACTSVRVSGLDTRRDRIASQDSIKLKLVGNDGSTRVPVDRGTLRLNVGEASLCNALQTQDRMNGMSG
jgi:hypothetical protein